MMTETPSPAIGSKIPLFFTYRDTFFGNGFVVEIQATNGRALCMREDDTWWMYGVNPGGMAAHGSTPEAAHRAFRRAFSKILYDIAVDSDNFDSFRQTVAEFFDQTNCDYESEWLQASTAIRARIEQLELPGIIRRLPVDSPRSVNVEMKRVSQVRAEDNRRPQFSPAIAA